ncbi:hypothetical protein Desde_0547 [Desulfitobacterium dehalogenans ATCC 51507]|uniref:Uncharacterized protein n=1 Tax=Desulfitobacterium dehalogenans (strain ATCC 51507 / DSM 9161 / JW/IU-DC1) TaxID=756499 RepID=I4A4X1_DESDJ|nr:DUF5986 family protein [Desulfitobacterium dehalogenans]AFL99005.1 hypothetical protein Desde_0547 [Desulfitobacterium dehalogenans ATCC 51507]
MATFTSLNMEDDARHAIANGIFTAVTSDIPELVQDYNLPTSNGVGLFRWNFINKNISENLGGRFQLSYAKRGPWKFLLLFERNNGITFSIMTEKNLSKLQKRLPEGTHYLESLIASNTGYDIVEGQLSLEFEQTSRDSDAINKLREELLSEFAGIIKNHILILFDYDDSLVISARAVLLTPELGIAYSEDWSHLLNSPYIIGKTSIVEDMRDDDNEPLVRMKGQKETPSEDLVSISEKPETANI